MPTVAEVLRQSGLSQEQIDALDAKVLTSFNGVLTSAERLQQEAVAKERSAAEAAAKAEADRKAAEAAQASARAAQDAAELQKRSVDEFWQNTYNPGVAQWEADRAALAKKAADAAAEVAFYKQQRESLKELGLVPADAPTFTPSQADPTQSGRGADGKFVPGGNGSPVFDANTVISKVGDGMNTITNIMWKHQSLYGAPLPIAPSDLIAKADALKLSPMEYAARTFRFAEKEEEMRQAEAKRHDDEIRAQAAAEKESEWKLKLEEREKEFAAKEKLRAEQGGNNPDVRVAVSSRIPELQRKVEAKEVPDPLMMNDTQRRVQTARMIKDTLTQKDQNAA